MRCVAIPIEETQRRALLHPALKLFKAALRELERLDAVLATQAGLHEAAVPVGASAQLASCITTKHGCKYFSTKLKYFCARILQDIYQSWMRNRRGQSLGCVRWRVRGCWRGCGARRGSRRRWCPRTSPCRSCPRWLWSSRRGKKYFVPWKLSIIEMSIDKKCQSFTSRKPISGRWCGCQNYHSIKNFRNVFGSSSLYMTTQELDRQHWTREYKIPWKTAEAVQPIEFPPLALIKI